jgi:hypothetical protein
MRWLILGLAAVPLLAAPLVAWAQPAGREELVGPALPGFVVGHDVGNERGSIREEIPRGETVEAWSRMVTSQRFAGLARIKPPMLYVRDSLAGLPRACPGARVSPIAAVRISGRSAARVQVDCPRGAGGRPESFMLLAVAGPSGDMHVKQVAWRGGTTPQTLAWGRSFLAGVMLCTAASREPICRYT